MKRTRKWEFVAQEAGRLAALGLSPLEISKRLGVNKSTVTRWVASGKLTRSGKRPKRRATTLKKVKPGQTPAEWAAAVRNDYDLDATDEQLVMLGEVALTDALDAEIAPSVRLAASGRFQAIVRQLALVARGVGVEDGKDVPKPSEKRTPTPRIARPNAADPRTLYLATAAK